MTTNGKQQVLIPRHMTRRHDLQTNQQGNVDVTSDEPAIGQSIYAKIWLNPPQIATEAFSSDLLPERSPEKHIKNVEKSRRANIIFFGKIQKGC